MSTSYERRETLREDSRVLRELAEHLPPAIQPPGLLPEELRGLRRILKRLVRKCSFWMLKPWYDSLSVSQKSQQESLKRAAEALEAAEAELHSLREQQERDRFRLELCAAELETLHSRTAEELQGLRQGLAAGDSRGERLAAELESMREEAERSREDLASLRLSSHAARNKMSRLLACSGVSESFWDKHSLSQSGEDSIAAYILDAFGIPPSACSYLDLGANHPKELSNTYYFYEQGARGVLAEANPALIPELKRVRPEDTVLNCCVGTEDGESVPFFVFDRGDGLSTASPESARQRLEADPSLGGFRELRVPGVSVNRLLEEYFPGGSGPLFLNVDTEGMDSAILRAIDFERFRPLVICAESIPCSGGLYLGERSRDIPELLAERGYAEYAFTGINSLFVDTRARKRSCGAPPAEEPRRLGEPRPYWDAFSGETMLFRDGGRYEDGLIVLPPGSTVFGPYISLSAGRYALNLSLHGLGGSGREPELRVTAGRGSELLTEGPLRDGGERLCLALEEDRREVEFVINNGSSGTVLLSRLSLTKLRKTGEET